MITKAIYPGIFDPLTNGHLDLVTRITRMFDIVLLAIAARSSKQLLFSLDERVMMATKVTAHLTNVIVMSFSGLMVDFAHEQQVNILIRGVRTIIDFDYEMQLAKTNRYLMPELETVFMMSSEAYSYISSTLVKEVALYGGNIDCFLPITIAKEVRKRFHFNNTIK